MMAAILERVSWARSPNSWSSSSYFRARSLNSWTGPPNFRSSSPYSWIGSPLAGPAHRISGPAGRIPGLAQSFPGPAHRIPGPAHRLLAERTEFLRQLTYFPARGRWPPLRFAETLRRIASNPTGIYSSNMSRRTKSLGATRPADLRDQTSENLDTWPTEFLAALGSWPEDIERPQQLPISELRVIFPDTPKERP